MKACEKQGKTVDEQAKLQKQLTQILDDLSKLESSSFADTNTNGGEKKEILEKIYEEKAQEEEKKASLEE